MRLLIFLITSSTVFPQAISVGITGGYPLTQRFDATTNPGLPPITNIATATANLPFGEPLLSATERTLPYAVGPNIEAHLVGALFLNVGALYSRATYDYQDIVQYSPTSGVSAEYAKRADSRWEFPVLLKWRFPRIASLSPYATAGVSAGYDRNYYVGGLVGYLGFAQGYPEQVTPFTGRPSAKTALFGPTFGGGLSFGKYRLKPSIEIRYTHWANQSIPAFLSTQLPIHAAANQVQLLVGVSF